MREFIERDLGPEGMARSVVVVATSDQPALVRIKAAFTATTIAEHFRDQGADVMLMMDSRHALRHGPARGRPGDRRAARDARLHRRACSRCCPSCSSAPAPPRTGTITALYTVLVDGDDMNEPIADAVRSILDGHIVLSRHLAHAGHYPAIDVLASVSRLVGEVTSRDVRGAGDDVRRLMAAYKEKEDLIAIGAYQPGTDPLTDAAIAARNPIEGFLRQRVDDPSSTADAERGVVELSAYAELVRAPGPAAPRRRVAAAANAAVPGASPEGPGTPLHAAIPPLNLSP